MAEQGQGQVQSKFTEMFNKTIATVNAKTSTLVGTAKLKMKISTLNTEIGRLTTEIGIHTYNTWVKGEFDASELEENLNKIKERYKQIEETKEMIKKIEEQKDVPPQTGQTIEETNDIKEDETEKPEVFVCGECAAEFTEPIKFCGKCGNKMQ